MRALLGIETFDELLSHPVAGPSWEGFVIENLLAAAPERVRPSFYRTATGAEIDLILELGGKHGTWAIEIKKSLAAKVDKGFFTACEDLSPNKAFVVYSGDERYPKTSDVEVIGVTELAKELAVMNAS